MTIVVVRITSRLLQMTIVVVRITSRLLQTPDGLESAESPNGKTDTRTTKSKALARPVASAFRRRVRSRDKRHGPNQRLE